jgi:hypothetical protein
MAHVHSWWTSQYLLLTLPDTEGYADRFVQWRCHTCPLYSEIDGNVRVGAPLEHPEYWHAIDPTSRWTRSRGARQWQREQRRRGV